jgi:hypothetical protein
MACVNHAAVAEVAKCAQCSTPLCADCVVVIDGRPLCGRCKTQVVRLVERGEAIDEGGREPSPWEAGRSLASLLLTVRQVILSPRTFFAKLRRSGPGHFSYLVAVSWPSAVLGAALNHLLGLDTQGKTGQEAQVLFWIVAAMVVFAPVMLILGVVVSSAITHVFLRVFGAANGRFEATLRTSVYVQSLAVINWIPIAGPIVGGIWGLGLSVIGLKRMHGTSTGRVIAALLLPWGFVIVSGLLAALALFAAKAQ